MTSRAWIPTLLALATACIALCIPILATEWLPFVDYPQHLGTIAAIHGAHDPRFQAYFVVEYARTQYLVLYVLGDLLAYFVGIEGSGRLTALLSVAPLPLAVAWFLHEHRRPAILGGVSVAVAIHMYVIWGFLNYAAGMITALLALAGFARMTRRPDAGHVALAGALGLVCFYTHAQLYAFFALGAVVQWIAMAPTLGRARALRALGASVVAALPSIIGMAVWLHLSGVIEHGEAGARSGHAAEVADAPPAWTPLHDTVRGFSDHAFAMYHDGSGEWLAVGLLFVVIALIAMRGEVAPTPVSAAPLAAANAAPSGWKRWLAPAEALSVFDSHAPEAILALAFVGYLFAPNSYRMIEPINHRFLPLALALLPCLGPRALTPRVGFVTAALVALLSAGTAYVHTTRFRAASEEMGELASALEVMEPGRRTLGLIHDTGSSIVRAPIFLHAHQYYQARNGGLACFSFVEFPKSPVQYREGSAPPPFPPRFEWEPYRYDHGVWGDAFDYWLVRHGAHQPAPSPFNAASPSGRSMPIAVRETDRWTVFATRPE